MTEKLSLRAQEIKDKKQESHLMLENTFSNLSKNSALVSNVLQLSREQHIDICG